MSGIYKITNPKGKIYIGQSVNPTLRLSHYKRFDCKEQPKIYNSLKKYGVENHVFEILCYCDTSELNEKERYYQELYNVLENGLNCRLTNSNDKSGFLSLETRQKMSLSQKGKKFSKESIVKMSNSRKGKTLGKDNPFFGKTHKKEVLELLSKKIKGRTADINGLNSKLILDTNTGVFYYSVKELSQYVNLSKSYLSEILRGSKNNKTQFIYV